MMGERHFERLFRDAAGLDVDKSDLKRLSDFLNQKVYDMLVIGQAAAKANDRAVIKAWDLPITKGLQEAEHRFRELNAALELQPILDQLAEQPQLDLPLGDDVQGRLPELTGGLTVALAEAFKAIDPGLKNPQAHHWDRVEAVFNRIL